jgi:peptidoglycan/LPS O-acetylase OafA/YrhL
VVFPLTVWMFARDRSELPDFLLLMAYTPVLLFCLSHDITARTSIQKVAEAAGNMTYSSYLLHFPIQLLIALGFAIAGAPIPLYNGTFFGIFIATTLLASYLTYRYFEAPAQNLVREQLLRPRAAIASVHGRV